MSTHNLCFWAETRKIKYTPVNPSFTTYKWGLRGSKLYRRVFVMQRICRNWSWSTLSANTMLKVNTLWKRHVLTPPDCADVLKRWSHMSYSHFIFAGTQMLLICHISIILRSCGISLQLLHLKGDPTDLNYLSHLSKWVHFKKGK